MGGLFHGVRYPHCRVLLCSPLYTCRTVVSISDSRIYHAGCTQAFSLLGVGLLHHHAYYLKEVGSGEREKLPSLIFISEY